MTIAEEPVDGAEAARLWLASRVDSRTTTMARQFLVDCAEDLSIASGDAATIRVLSADGRWLLPLVAHHPDLRIQDAMTSAMRRTAETATSGLWFQVIHERRAVVWDLTDQAIPVEASATQARFLRDHPVTFVMAMPVLAGDQPVGGVSLVRYVTRRTFDERDVALLREVAVRAATAIDFGGLSLLDPPDAAG